MRLNRRFARPARKNLAWTVSDLVGTFNSATLASGVLLLGNQLTAGVGKQTVNLKRLIFQMNVGVRTGDLLGTGDNNETWGRAAWMLTLLDEDDTTAYNPDDADTLAQETIIRDGITERVGWGTVSNLIAPSVASQTAVFMATTRIAFDVKSNRRLTSDQLLRLFIVRTAFADLDNDHIDVSFGFEARLRTLYQIP